MLLILIFNHMIREALNVNAGLLNRIVYLTLLAASFMSTKRLMGSAA